MNSFDKIIGYKSIKQELLQICDMFRNWTIYEEMGAHLPHGVLLYGDPGLGKTLLAKCFIEESGLKTITVRRDKGGDAFVDSITKAFAKAKKEAPAIVFLDDMDKFANEDASRCDAPEYVAVQSGIDDVKDINVFVLATANETCKLPDSLRRSGRFDRKIYVRTPTRSDAAEIIAYYLKKKKVADGIDMQDLTKMMSYNSCAELETILNEAAIRAAFSRKDRIQMEDMVSAVLKQQYGARENATYISDEVVRDVALHEAGHLVVCEILCPGSVGFASLLPSRENSCGGFVHNCQTIYDDIDDAIITLSGKAAVEMHYAGQTADGCRSDINRAVNLIRNTISLDGRMGFALYDVESKDSSGMSENLNARSETAVQAELERCYNKAKGILAKNDAFLKAVTEALIEKKTLLYSDIQKIRSATVKGSPAAVPDASLQYNGEEEDAVIEVSSQYEANEDGQPMSERAEKLRQEIRRKLEEHQRNRMAENEA